MGLTQNFLRLSSKFQVSYKCLGIQDSVEIKAILFVGQQTRNPNLKTGAEILGLTGGGRTLGNESTSTVLVRLRAVFENPSFVDIVEPTKSRTLHTEKPAP